MRIHNLRVENFRSFRGLEMSNLGRINLIVGTNNSGKSTVLEAITMLLANGDTPAIWSMLGQRGEIVAAERGTTDLGGKPIQIWRLFPGYEIEVGACLAVMAHTDAGYFNMTGTIAEYDPLDADFLWAKLPPIDPAEERLPPLLVQITWWSDAELLIPIRGRDGISTMAIRRNSQPGSRGFPLRFVTASSQTADSVTSLLDDIVLTPEEELVTDALRIIEPTIQRIAPSRSDRPQSGAFVSSRGGVLVRLEANDTRVPIGSMGDGIWRMLGLALNLVHSKDGVLLVDDIDTGLHHTVMTDMWKFLYSAAKKYNVQVFATTHSRDCYESLAVISGDSDSEHSDVTIQRIERGRKAAVAYSERAIRAAAKHAIEVR